MEISWKKTINELCGDYYEQLSKNLDKAKSLTKEIKELVRDFLRESDRKYNGTTDFVEKLKKYVHEKGIIKFSELFDGELKGMTDYLLGDEWSDLLCRYVKLKANSPYTVGYYRRSIRCDLASLHINYTFKSAFNGFVMLRASGFSVEEILRGGRTPEEIKEIGSELRIAPWLAAMINSGNRECIDYLKEAMTSENNSNRITYDHLRAIVTSGNKELLDLEGKLLLAARLQEGLRQAILETMDEGLPESFIHLLGVIRENNLQRFAAVKRGLAVTTGLAEPMAPERITDKFLELVYRYATVPEDAQAAVMSKDAMEVYLGLWGIAFYDVRNIEKPIKELIDSSPAYRVEAAMLLLSAAEFPKFESNLVSDVLHKRIKDHGVIAGALPMYLARNSFYVSWYGAPNPVPPLSQFFDSREEAMGDFELLTELIGSIKAKEVFEPYVFPWISVELSRGEVATRICKIALLLNSSEYIDRALDYVAYMEPYTRAGFIKYMLHHPHTRKQIEYAINLMTDRGTEARDTACEIVMNLHKAERLSPEDYRAIENHLRLKAAGMRVAIISILSSLPENEAAESVKRLLADKTADRRLAGLDIIKNWLDNGERSELSKSLLSDVEAISRPTSKEKVLIESILATAVKGDDKYNASNGFGLYNPKDDLHLKVREPENFSIEKSLTFKDSKRAEKLMLKLMDVIKENADFEFVDTWGEVRRLGNTVKRDRYGHNVDSLAKPELWREFYKNEIGSSIDMLRLYVAVTDVWERDSSFFKVMKSLLGKTFHENGMSKLKKKEYYELARTVVTNLFESYGSTPETWDIAADILAELAINVDADDMLCSYKEGISRWERERTYAIYNVVPFRIFTEMLDHNWYKADKELFLKSFRARYALYKKIGYKKDFNPVSSMEYMRLWRLGLITDNEFWHEMLGREDSPSMVRTLTNHLPNAQKRYSYQKDVPRLAPEECVLVNTAVDRILDIELKRGDTPTVVSSLAKEISVITGIDYLIKILVGLGKDKPMGNFYGMGDSKRGMFSWLLHVSCPGPDDTPQRLKKMAEEAGISDERLVEAALYSPRWLELVEKAIGWNGLTSAAYYFLAHTGDNLGENEKSYISRFTSVAPEDFADGAFDPGWFHEVYRQLGKKRFEVVYDAAKYISEGNRHTRSRKLSDAVLGNLKVKDVTAEIVEKRNKDSVVAFGLIPLGRNRLKDLRQRYALLNRFLKESKQFGAQRQASEGRAVKLALDNLARTAGYGDSTRLTWGMEADLVKEVAEYLAPKEVDGVTAYISLGEATPELILESKGKRLQSVPTRLKKDKYIERLKEVYKQLKEQHVRGRALLEKSMVEASNFTGAEMAQLRENPIIWELFSRLVMVKGENDFGFPGEDGHSLVSPQGVVTEILPEDNIRIAHPYDMMKGGVWSDYQTALFDRRWRQPFKQVFRELYVPTEDEKLKSQSMRYAGNQIMPARTVGLLKKRQWIVDYENGLEKICFHGDVTAVMYALADWFSPSDIEAPTLEYVAFYDRRSFKDKKIADVDPIVFSEIMRDVDLAVSVAHAGGVDPETSHSTVEMRRVIVEHAMPMFGIENVVVEGNFAKIKGALGNYNVHLGSGVIHKEGGAQIAVLPVHSQGRGRIFLPFLDEDPKTAEIISKILLFAEDTKIKDPSILSQI